MSAPRTSAVVADPVVVPAGTTAGDAVAAAGLPTTGAAGDRRGPGLSADGPAARPGLDPDVRHRGRCRSPIDSPDGLAVLRHSAAHVLAQAVQDLFPEAKLGIGPPIEDGFYYDFDVAPPFTPEDLDRLEKRMQEIVKAGQRFRRRVFARSRGQGRARRRAVQARAGRPQGSTPARRPPRSMEVGAGELTIYDNLDPRPATVCWTRPVPRPARAAPPGSSRRSS